MTQECYLRCKYKVFNYIVFVFVKLNVLQTVSLDNCLFICVLNQEIKYLYRGANEQLIHRNIWCSLYTTISNISFPCSLVHRILP